jgi:hypothetical protein
VQCGNRCTTTKKGNTMTTTTYLKLPGGNRIAVPRGAVWGAALFARLLRPLQAVGQHRAEKALFELARSYESTQPGLASDYREAALRAREARIAARAK